MASNPANLRAIYRSLLRELPPRPILSSPRSPLHTRIRSQFTSTAPQPSPPSPSSPPSAATPSAAPPASTASPSQPAGDRAAHAAQQLVAYLRSQRLYVSLVERYNPAMEMDQNERIRLTARRVGMDLPPVKK